MISTTKYLCAIFLFFFLIGCGTNSRYNWNGYDAKMYHHYKNPSEREQFVQALKEILDYAEPQGKVPPGIYAEYGFVLYEEGNNQQAVLYFQKEAEKWPESRVFMTKLIAMANNRAKNKKENIKLPVGSEADASKNASKQPSEVPK